MKGDKKMVPAIVMVFIMVSSALMISPVVAHPADGTVKYWALIVSGSGDRDTFTANTDYMYHVIRDHSDFNGVYYLAPDPSHHGVNDEATKANVRSAITNWLGSRSDDDDIIFIYFSSHGAGYHTTEGLEGGRLDASGDEGNEHQESTIIVSCWRLNTLYDLDGDGAIDDLVRNLDADVYIDYDVNNDGTIDGDFRIMRDYDGDGNADDLLIDPDSDDQCDIAIDANLALASDGEDMDNDGKIIGVDLNGNGDQNDWVGYDEYISLNNQDWTRAEKYWDDELAGDFNTLQYDKLIFVRQGCVDLPAMEEARELFVREGCDAFSKLGSLSCFGGGLIDDISAPDRIIVTATNETTYSYGDGDGDGYSEWSEAFLDALHAENTHWIGGCIINEDPIEWVDADVNNDGHVSVKEAWDYAWSNDDARPWETPWLDDDGNGRPTFLNGADQLDPNDGAVAGSIWIPFRPGPVNRSIADGLAYLRCHQDPDGSWQNSVGITSMAALAFLNAGHTEDDSTVNKAIHYILANRNVDGSFGWGTYETSLAVLALVATHNASYNDEIANARDWLVDAQYDEGEGAAPTDACYGGWRYGSSPGDGDLSNTQFALMALSAAGLPSGSDTWTKAVTFTTRCQNRPASNDQAWAHDNTQPSYNDGGFIYVPSGRSLAGGTKSYGSMTAAGIWSLRLCGVDVPDGRVQDGLTWLTNNEDCSFDDSPGHPYGQGHCFLYYYYMTTAKALAMCFLNDLGGVDWYAALSTKLADLQYDDGHWVNAPASHGQEDVPELATDFALLALQTRQPPPANLWMSIILASNATLTVYDPQGRHARLGDVTIPGATFEIDAEGSQIVNLTELEAGKYRIELKGTADGNYSLTIEGYREEEQTSSETVEGAIEEGEYQKSDVLVTSMVGALTIYVEEPEPLLVTDLPNVELVSADPTVTSINVTSLNLSEVNETYKPEECTTPQSAYMVNSTGAGNFTLKFTDIPNANIIIVYKINATNQWIDLGATTTADTVTFTMSVEDPPVVFCPGTLPASIRIEPETLNLASKGVFTAFIQLPEGYDVADINVTTVVCEGAPAVRGMVSEEDMDTYIAKFNRQELVNVAVGDAVELTVTGNLYDGAPFEGSDTIRVMDKGKGK